MAKILISVTSIAEAQLALDCGADIIDLKDPSAGALGALPLSLIQAIASHINGRKLVSATIGDLPMDTEMIVKRVTLLAETNVDYIKIGFFEAADFNECLAALKLVTQNGIKLIAVLFAEYYYPESLLDAIKKAGFIGIMLDTAKKNGQTFFDYYSVKQSKEFANKILALDLTFGLAGSLKLENLIMAQQFNPSYIGFRGGVCDENKRQLALSAEKIMAICNLNVSLL
jgi:uncharacterized protein (UPF0264 family)